jgi:hypothetical protein
VHAETTHALIVRIESEEEEGDTVAEFEFLSMQRFGETVAGVLSFGPIQVEPPQIRPLRWVVALESNTGTLVNETGAVPVSAMN